MLYIQFIRRGLQSILDLFDNKKFRDNFLNALPFWVGAFITGFLAVLYARVFAWAETGSAWLLHRWAYSFFIITPLTFLAGRWIVKKYAPFAVGSGIPQVSAAIELANPKQNHLVEKLLSVRVVVVKVISSLIMILGGAVIGREGPTIQISAAVFKKINDLLPPWYPSISKRNMIVTGAAAGLASAFNTPLGGIVFAIEELTKTHFSFLKTPLLTGVIIAGLTALNLLGPYLYLGYPPLNNISAWITLAVIPLAIATGLLSAGMASTTLFLIKERNALKGRFKKIAFLVACGLVVAAMGVLIDARAFGSGKSIIITSLFTSNKYLDWYVPVLRIIGPVVSFASGAAGGIFAPALSAGASMGAVAAGWLKLADGPTHLLILCGMAGFLTGVTRSPFTSAILVIEMTDSHSVIFQLMLTGLLANLSANIISGQSFYEQLKELHLNMIMKEEKAEAEATGREVATGELELPRH